MYLTKRAAIFHTPKCGGMTVRHALLNGELMQYWDRTHATPGELDERPRPFQIALVRHPLRWYRSLWAYMRRYRGPKDARRTWWARMINLELWPRFNPCLPQFLESVLAAHPRLASRVFERFTENVDFVVRTEHLLVELCQALEQAGEPFDRKVILEAPPYNASPTHEKIPPALAERIAAREACWIRRYYGREDFPADVVAANGTRHFSAG